MINLLDKVSTYAGVISFFILMVEFFICAKVFERYSVQFKSVAAVFYSLFFMCAVFTFTTIMIPQYPDHAPLWRMVGRPGLIVAAASTSWFLWRWFRSQRSRN